VLCAAAIATGCHRTSRRDAHSATPPARGQVVCTAEDATLACAIVDVPAAHPLTMVLLAKPRDHTRGRSSFRSE